MKKEWIAGTPKLWINIPVPIPFCPGCNHGTAAKLLCDVIGEMDIAGNVVLVVGVGCSTVIYMLINVDAVMVAHGRPCDAATAIKRLLGDDTYVITLQGDGDALAIGTESTVHAAARSEKITTIMLNNGNYGTTGGQLAPTTPMNRATTTSPEGRIERHGYPIKATEFIGGLEGVAYSARGAFNNVANYQRTKKYLKTALEKQRDKVGYSFLEILNVCPSNWHLSPRDSISLIEDEIIPEFPLGEYKNIDKRS